MTRRSTIGTALKPNSKERFFNSRGDMNATSSRDALMQVAALIDAVQRGEISLSDTAGAEETYEEVRARKQADNAAFIEAYHAGVHSKSFQDVSAAITVRVADSMERQGFMRNNLVKGTVSNGEAFRVRRAQRGLMTAVATTTGGGLAARYVNDAFIEGFFYRISENVRVRDEDIFMGADDLVEDVYLRMQQAIATKEDAIYMRSVRYAAQRAQHTRTATSLTPLLLGAAKADLDVNAVPASKMFIGTSMWQHFLSSNFQFDPATQYEMMRTGRIGSLLGMDTYTDGFRLPGLQAMDPNEIFMVSTPEYHGGWAERAPLVATPRDNFDDGEAARGWFMYVYVASVIANINTVSHITMS
jgi:hypothetical protein